LQEGIELKRFKFFIFEAVMKNFSLLFLIGLSFISCNTSDKMKHEKEVGKLNYHVKFNKVDKQFIESKKQKALNFYNDYLGSDRFNGMFLVAKNGKILLEKYNGYANYEQKKEVSPSTPLHLASISKVSTCIAILRLVDQKKILLDEDIRNFLPEIPYEGISVRMLLNHRSGIPYYGYFTYNSWPLSKPLTNKDVLLLLKKYKFPLNFKPDNHFAYCNTNYALLALIVEKVTDLRFPKAMEQLIFKPLKMTNSFILDNSRNYDSVAQSYNSNMVRQRFDYLDYVYGDKNMFSTARDLLKLDKGTYSNNFLSKSSKEQMFKGYSYENAGTKNYGLGIRMVELENKEPYFFHTGWWHGNTGCYATLRGDTVCIIALSNSYDRSVYQIKRLTPYFGNYPFEFEDEE
jgi:CubicO group peptidase (beta-lactamase class C family)